MSPSSHSTSNPPTPDSIGFLPTRWSLILAAAQSTTPTARVALEELARTYWFPLYAFIRRRGYAPEAAEDLTQEFFARLLEKNTLASADPTKGKFRAFLLTSAKNFLTNEHLKAHTQKRAGTSQIVPLDALSAEARYALEPASDLTPERLFEQHWAHAVLDAVLAQLRLQYECKNQLALFETLKPALTSPTDAHTHAAMAAQLHTTPNAVTVAIHRLRRHYRELLRDHIAQTVASPDLIEEEIHYLLKCL